jgi:hypothetical protein
MKRALIIVALAVTALVPSAVLAAPAQPQCTRAATTQFDMAGAYRAGMLYVEIFPCGGIYVEWTNPSSTHTGGYVTEVHASDGVIATFHTGEAFGGQPGLIVKAAERGYVQVATADSSLNVVDVYRLRKIS